MKKSLFIALGIITGMFFILNSCKNPGVSPATGPHTVSSRVIDIYTGAPVPDAKVGFGMHTGKTDGNGNYSFTVDDGETITGNFYACRGSDYQFMVIGGLNITPSSDVTYNLALTPSLAPGYTLSGQVFEDNGSTQIADNSSITFTIYNENGGSSSYDATYNSSNGGYSITTATFGTNCLISLQINNDNNSTPTHYSYYDTVDIPSANTTHDFTKPSTGFSTVTVNGNGESFSAIMQYSNTITIDQIDETLSGTSMDIDIYNPDNKEFIWSTETDAIDTPASGDVTANIAVSTPSVPGTSVDLPVFSGVTAPTVTASNISYSNGVLSFDGDAEFFYVSLEPDEGGLSGSVYTPSKSTTLPADIQAILESNNGYSNWDVSVYSMNASVSFTFDTVLNGASNDGNSSGISFNSFGGSASGATDLIP